MRSFLAITTYTFRKLMNRKRAIGLMLLSVVPAAIVGLVGPRASDSTEVFHGMAVGVLMAVVLPVIGIVNAAGALGDERRDHTLPYLSIKPVARSLLVGAALAGAVGATLLIGTVGVGTLWIAGGLVSGEWTVGAGPAIGLVVIAFGYGSVFLPVGFLFKRATLIGLLYVFFWEAILASAVTSLAASSLWRIGLQAYAATLDTLPAEFTDSLGNVSPSIGSAFLKVGVLIVLSVALSTWLLRVRDHVVGDGD
jgi:ABC-type transport system involved in multi-copper enzyme maturation permease subunit